MKQDNPQFEALSTEYREALVEADRLRDEYGAVQDAHPDISLPACERWQACRAKLDRLEALLGIAPARK